ncbi:hypothetical protein [Streptomyces sp. NPDC058757]|uniref:hypothetical protein n=1 Tax=Streptomyces sp. NPDC058757 TaxID=3346626 RepID=UPI0036855658
MDDFAFDEGLLPGPRVPLLTVDEARSVIATLAYFADDSEEGRAASGLAHLLAMRVPAAE